MRWDGHDRAIRGRVAYRNTEGLLNYYLDNSFQLRHSPLEVSCCQPPRSRSPSPAPAPQPSTDRVPRRYSAPSSFTARPVRLPDMGYPHASPRNARTPWRGASRYAMPNSARQTAAPSQSHTIPNPPNSARATSAKEPKPAAGTAAAKSQKSPGPTPGPNGYQVMHAGRPQNTPVYLSSCPQPQRCSARRSANCPHWPLRR